MINELTDAYGPTFDMGPVRRFVHLWALATVLAGNPERLGHGRSQYSRMRRLLQKELYA